MSAVTRRSTSSSLKSKLGMRSLSSGCRTRPRSKMRVSCSFVLNHSSLDVCGIVLMNANRVVKKGQPKNFIPEDRIRPLAAAFLRAEPVDGQLAVITRAQAEEADYNLSPSRWVTRTESADTVGVATLVREMVALDEKAAAISKTIRLALAPLIGAEPEAAHK